jgi:hypothetical protein
VSSLDDLPTADLLDALTETLDEMESGRVEAGGGPTAWNRLVDRAQAIQLVLRERPDGRSGISALMDSQNPTVRGWAVAWSLFWDEPRARAVLAQDAAGSGLGALDAKMALREFDAGRLNMTWQPKSG